MRLLYWYTRFLDADGKTREYHGLKEFELNLSTTEEYHYKPNTNTFEYKPHSNPLPKDFWGHQLIYNLNVIVGNNGAGKTTVIHTMMDTLQQLYNRKIECCNEIVILFEDKKKVLLHLTGSSSGGRMNCTFPQLRFSPGIIRSSESILACIDRIKLFYITNTLSELDDQRYQTTDNQPHMRANFIYDCSLIGMLRHDANEDCYRFQQSDYLHTYFVNENYKQVKFVCDHDQHQYISRLREKQLPIPLPKELSIKIRSPRNQYKKLFDYSQHVINQKEKEDRFAYLLCVSCYYTFLENITKLEISRPPEQIKAPKSATLEQFRQLFMSIQADTNRDDLKQRLSEIQARCLRFVSYVCESKHRLRSFQCSKVDAKALQNGESATLTIPVNDDNSDWLIGFMERYRFTCVPYYFLDFNWGLSSGENNLLRLFSSLFYAFDYSGSKLYNWSEGKRRADCDSVLLLMDEADLTYHPEWQRQLVQILTAFLPLEFGECGVNNLQVILTTHSPLILGDIPTDNVVYLGKHDNKAKSTFGQNIHSILKDSFFLSSGTVGSFAAEKIDSTAKRLRELTTPESSGDQSQKELDSLRQIISLVAPGVIQAKLKMMLNDAERALEVHPNDNERTAFEQIRHRAKNLTTDEKERLISEWKQEIKKNNPSTS